MRVSPLLKPATVVSPASGKTIQGWQFVRPPLCGCSGYPEPDYYLLPLTGAHFLFIDRRPVPWSIRTPDLKDGWGISEDRARQLIRQHIATSHPEYVRLLSAISVEGRADQSPNLGWGRISQINFVERNIAELGVERGDVLVLIGCRAEYAEDVGVPNMHALTTAGYEVLRKIVRAQHAPPWIDISPWSNSDYTSLREFVFTRSGWGTRAKKTGRWFSRVYAGRVGDAMVAEAIEGLLREPAVRGNI